MSESKTLALTIVSEKNIFGENYCEYISTKTDRGTNISYAVHDLSDCLEDAILGRSLFSAIEYIEALQLGMKLAQEGYTDISVDYKDEDEGEDE